jgi:hypothetical protein
MMMKLAEWNKRWGNIESDNSFFPAEDLKIKKGKTMISSHYIKMTD